MREQGTSPQSGTAGSRDPVLDLVRFICLVLVVVGHSMMVSPVLHPDGTVTTQNTLGDQGWFEPVIWVFMVMPLFFVTGGVTGLQSWQRLRSRGSTATQFLHARLLRLVRPAAALLAAMFLGLWAASVLGVHPQVVQLMASGAAMPLWFLAAYLTAQLNIPLLAAFHARSPWLAMGVLSALVVVVDCLRGTLPLLAYANLVFLWCAVQQLGFLAADGRFARLSRSSLLAVILAANLLLGLVVALDLYSGNMLVNLNPPNLTLLLLGISQAALLELARPALSPLCSLHWLRVLLRLAGGRSLTIYLWHLPLLAGMSGLLLLTSIPKPASGTAEWWWARPLVLLALALLLLPVVVAFGRMEDRPTTALSTRRRPTLSLAAAVVVVFIPVVGAAVNGLTLAVLGAGAACFWMALVMLGGVRGVARPWSSPGPRHGSGAGALPAE
ncbi:acyltransferase [Pseudarthrobacter sp. NamB4]|uniref:acyltransferase family protein n=1 Tax=Pseudarthrobacter sp. NamB4 TaxID=2576837 RepID=UPI0010FEC1F8|nr:acyltransferase [Pseudarthrobacter sp. NamB4]TLM75538.1 acyltransferase [Pseudarthrobacter sp. NamB4]